MPPLDRRSLYIVSAGIKELFLIRPTAEAGYLPRVSRHRPVALRRQARRSRRLGNALPHRATRWRLDPRRRLVASRCRRRSAEAAPARASRESSLRRSAGCAASGSELSLLAERAGDASVFECQASHLPLPQRLANLSCPAWQKVTSAPSSASPCARSAMRTSIGYPKEICAEAVDAAGSTAARAYGRVERERSDLSQHKMQNLAISVGTSLLGACSAAKLSASPTRSALAALLVVRAG